MSDNEVLREQQRTTHAVRAIAVFILILFPASFISTLLLAWGFMTRAACGGYCSSYEPSGGPQFFFGGLLLLAGIVTAIVRGWAELVQSDPSR